MKTPPKRTAIIKPASKEEQIAYCKIYPSIGIARVGNSPDGYFIGPEIPGTTLSPHGGFKDHGDPRTGTPARIKRQAARFRLYTFNDKDELIGEITTDNADISWTVHLVNSKAEGDRFAGLVGEDLPIGQRRPKEFWRNKEIEDRGSLIIDPGPRTVNGPNQRAKFEDGMFRELRVPLGEIFTDADGRLLVLGGTGNTSSPNPGQPIVGYANNDLWHDDVSDGPVKAEVRLGSGKTIRVVPAWVIVAPPDFAPSIRNVVTLYDVALDTALRNDHLIPTGNVFERPSFTNDIAPIFDSLAQLKWVQTGGRGAGSQGAEFEDLSALSTAETVRRKAVFARFRNPNLPIDSPEAKAQANQDFLPALSGDSGDASPGAARNWLLLTQTQYDILGKWRDGAFENDWKGSLPDPVKEVTPLGLTRAALEACAGGAFYPGIEAGWLLRNPLAYSEPFRLSHEKLKAGDATRRMACPWQADFYECSWHWWPAQRPDEVLTLVAYKSIRDIEYRMQELGSDESELKKLTSERTALLQDRSSWSRGLPTASYAGDVAMIENWSQHGFITNIDESGEPFVLNALPAHIETERGKYDGLSWPEYFHILVNIEQHPDFTAKARELAMQFFAGADYGADDFYAPFEYGPEAFDRRMTAIYDAFVLSMEDESSMNTGKITWPVVVRYEGDKAVREAVPFSVGRFSERALRERLRQRAPFNLVDGAWLQRIQSAGPIDDIRAHLFTIWDDEAGNGRTEQNHCNVYDTLLRSLNIYMPSLTSRNFIEQDLLPNAFIQPVFQLAVSLFPEEFFPEILGMTLYLEWEATPTLTPIVNLYRSRGIDPHFYSLHVAIDNITAGHGQMAKEAIKLYLAKVENEGGNNAVQDAWQRIWKGYVTWATAGDLGTELLELLMTIDHKQIDVCYPWMLTEADMLQSGKFITDLKSVPTGGSANRVSIYLFSQFRSALQDELRLSSKADLENSGLVKRLVDELNRLVRKNESFFEDERFSHLKLGEDTKALLAQANVGEDLVHLNRLLLRDAYSGIIAGVPKLAPILFPDYRIHFEDRFVEVIEKKAYAAKPMHRNATLGGMNLAELFNDPRSLARTLAASDWVDAEHPRSSHFLQLLDFSGPMYKIFTDEEKVVILDWIESLRVSQTPTQSDEDPAHFARQVLAFLRKNANAGGQVPRHSSYDLAGRPLQEWFADPLGLMAAFAGSQEWVVPFKSAASRLYVEFTTGKMYFMGPQTAEMFKNWIDTGAVLVPEETPPAAAFHGAATAPPKRPMGATNVSAEELHPPGVLPAVLPRQRSDFAAKRKLIGMGAVH